MEVPHCFINLPFASYNECPKVSRFFLSESWRLGKTQILQRQDVDNKPFNDMNFLEKREPFVYRIFDCFSLSLFLYFQWNKSYLRSFKYISSIFKYIQCEREHIMSGNSYGVTWEPSWEELVLLCLKFCFFPLAEFLSQGLNPCHSSDNARSLTARPSGNFL